MVQTVLFLYNMPYVFQLVVAEYENTLFGKYWCARPNHLSNMPVEKWKEISGIFKTEVSQKLMYVFHLPPKYISIETTIYFCCSQ